MFGIRTKKDVELATLKEALTLYERTLEDIGWINMNQDDNTSLEMFGESFKKMLKRVKLYYTRNPLAGHWVGLTTSFVFGEGLPKPIAKDKSIQEVIDKFWDDPDNKMSLTSYQAQESLGNKLQYEGNIFFALFDDDIGNVRVRILDTAEVADIIKYNEDRLRPAFYKINVRDKKYNFQSDTYDRTASEYIYYPDFNIFDINEFKIPRAKLRDEVRIFHVKHNCDINDKFGVPVLYRGIDWMKAHKDMAGDLATLIRSLSKFAWKKKVKGTTAQVNAIKTLLQSKRDLTNIGPAAGSMQIENRGIDMQAISTPTGGAVIGEKGLRQMLLMVCSASGIPEHYYGNPDSGNLATSKSMELPVVKRFANYQKLWGAIYNTIIQYQINKKIEAGILKGDIEKDHKNKRIIYATKIDRLVDLDFPPIVEEDLKEYTMGLVLGKDNHFISQELGSQLFLMAANVNNVEEEVKKALEEKKTADAKAQDINKNTNLLPGKLSPEEEAKQKKIQTDKEKKDLKESVIAPKKASALRFAKKGNYVQQRMNGYAKALNSYFKKFQRETLEGLKYDGEKGLVVGIIDNFDMKVADFGDGMKHAAREYYPIAIDIGKKFLQAHIKETKIRETLYEAEGRGDTLLKEKIEWNDKYITTSLIPDMKKKINEKVRQPYETQAEMKAVVSETIDKFESRVEQYAGAFWSVEEAAVKEAGKGTGLKVNFAGADDGGTCEGCNTAMEGNPYLIDDAPEPGSFECDGRCRHALQILEAGEE